MGERVNAMGQKADCKKKNEKSREKQQNAGESEGGSSKTKNIVPMISMQRGRGK
jgi:hypothetical protein